MIWIIAIATLLVYFLWGKNAAKKTLIIGGIIAAVIIGLMPLMIAIGITLDHV